MIYDQLYVSVHIKSNASGGVFHSSCTFKDCNNTIGKSINLLKCVCHASLSFIDPFNNPIIKCLKEVNLFDTCGNETPSAMSNDF